MLHIPWLLTSNNIENVPDPVRNRFQVIEILDVTTEQLQQFAVKDVVDFGLSEAVLMTVDQAPVVTGQRMRSRDCRADACETAEMLEGRPRLQ